MRRNRRLFQVTVNEGLRFWPVKVIVLLAAVFILGTMTLFTRDSVVLMCLSHAWYLPVALASYWYGTNTGFLFGAAVGLTGGIVSQFNSQAVVYFGWVMAMLRFGLAGAIIGCAANKYARREREARIALAMRHRQEADAASSQHQFLRVLSLSIDARDPYTRYHSDHVARYAISLGRALDLPRERLLHLGWAGLLHDLGKVGVPERILHKPGPLTAEEMRIVRRHPLVSAQILEPVTLFSPIIPAVRGHHERWDGSGYPDGLRQRDIPLFARILAICDVYEALSSGRPYRSPWPRRKVIDYMISGSGVLFDPELVMVFLRVLPLLTVEQPSPTGASVLTEMGQLYHTAAVGCQG